MKVLYLVCCSGHPHCYGSDNLCTGLYNVLGADNVFDWPEKPCMHLATGKDRDNCNIDSDAWLPSKGALSIGDIIPQVDLAIIACQPDDEPSINRIRVACRLLPPSVPIACVDMTDHVRDFSEFFTDVAGRPLVAYFKRELPLGATWGTPLPLSYPESRTPAEFPVKQPLVFYHATHHGKQPWGLPRIMIAEQLRKLLPPEQLDVCLYPGQEKGSRPSPEEYHARMSRALVGLSWNGYPYVQNWDTNRFWESFAYGLCLVAERPRIQIPHEPEHAWHCWYVDSAEEIPETVVALMRTPELAEKVGLRGREHFLKYHTSEARVRYVLQRCGFAEAEGVGRAYVPGNVTIT